MRQASVSSAEWESAERTAQLESLVPHLQNKDAAGTSPRALAQLLQSILVFQNETLGSSGKTRDRSMLKIPSPLFEQFGKGGATACILDQCFEYKALMQWRHFDFASASRRTANIDLLRSVQDVLVSKKLLRMPRVHVLPGIPEDVASEVARIVTRVGGAVVASADGATHVTHADTTAVADDDDEYFRPVRRSADGKRVLVHYWYSPHSCDVWLPASEVNDDSPGSPPAQATQPVHVFARFWLDTDAYNEWMDPEDYVPEDSASPKAAAAAGTATSRSRKRKAETAADEGDGTGPSTLKRQKKSAAPMSLTKENTEAENLLAEEDNRQPAMTPLQAGLVDHRASEDKPTLVAAAPVAGTTLLNVSHDGQDVVIPVKHDPSRPPGASNPPVQVVLPKRKRGRPSRAQIAEREAAIAAAKAAAEADGTTVIVVDESTNTVSNLEAYEAQSKHQGHAGYASGSSGDEGDDGGDDDDDDDDVDPDQDGDKRMSEAGDSDGSDSESGEQQQVNLDLQAAVDEAVQYPVVIPSHSSWFSIDAIHEIEKRSINEFFNGKSGSKTPRVYKYVRDFMINTFRQNPRQYLTFTAVRRNLHGDVCAMLRIFQFLEHWGLINYNVDAKSRPMPYLPPSTNHYPVVADTPAGFAAVPMEMPALLQESLALHGDASGVVWTFPEHGQLDDGDADAAAATAATAADVVKEEGSGGTDGGTGGAESESKFKFSATASGPRYNCRVCRAECSRVRWRNDDEPSICLCMSCFAQGRIPNGMTSHQFTRVDAPGTTRESSGWSDEETLRLLEAIEIYADSWNDVAEHVGTKDKAACIMHFLQMPIEDQYLNASLADGPIARAHGAQQDETDGSSARQGNGKRASRKRTPGTAPDTGADDATASGDAPEPELFAASPNPVMMLVSFLASSVSQPVAAAAAKAAMRAVVAEDGPDAPDDASDVPALQRKLKVGAAAALAAVVVKARSMAENEEREILNLVARATALQLQKLELKMTRFAALERMLDKEREQVNSLRSSLEEEKSKWLADRQREEEKLDKQMAMMRAAIPVDQQ